MGANLASGSVRADLVFTQPWTVGMVLDLGSIGTGREPKIMSADLELGGILVLG